MPEPTILCCGPALDPGESASSLEMLRRISLAGAAKFVVTTSKFDAGDDVKAVNVEGSYPAEPAVLQTLVRWAEGDGLQDPAFRDGYDLYCLSRILERHKRFEYAVLLRGGASTFDSRWSALRDEVNDRLVVTFDEDNAGVGIANSRPSLLIDLGDERTLDFLAAALELYSTGAVFGMAEYSLDRALSIALSSVERRSSLLRAADEVVEQPAETDGPSRDRSDQDRSSIETE